jgi:hypothetical protein
MDERISYYVELEMESQKLILLVGKHCDEASLHWELMSYNQPMQLH